MTEGGCEKFPDHWNPEFFWTVIVEYLSQGCPVDILVKRWVTVGILFPLFLLFSSWMFSFFIYLFIFFFKLNNITDSTFVFLRIFLSYKSRKLILESELSTNPNPSDSCGCAPSDGSFPKTSDPTCEFVRRWEVFKFLW